MAADESIDESIWEDEACTRQYNYQSLFNRWREFDKEQDGFMKTDIGILLFSQAELPPGRTPPPLSSYYKLYDKTQQKTIETIVTQIRAKIPSQRVAFGFTFLIARVEKDIKQFLIFRCARVPPSDSDVFYIEPSGRVYQNWIDFVNSNKLPHCQYVAPNDGIYKVNGEMCKYNSPEANKSFVQRHVDKVVTVAGVGIVGASVCSVAPLAVGITGVAVGAYSAIQSVVNLYDRHAHSESIKPDNMDAISNHLTLATASLTGLSSAALACRPQIMNRLGKWAPAVLRTMNIGVLTLDAAGLIFQSVVFHDKWNSGDLTMMDALNLVLQVYLLHGQISNTIEIHRMLSSNSTAAPVRLTKTQKRNLRKRRAKAAKRGQPLNSTTVKVTESGGTFESMKWMALNFGVTAVTFLRKHYHRDEIIIQFLNDVKQLVSNLWKGNISPEDFFLNLELHVRNLMQILKDDIDSLRRYSNLFGFEPDVNASGAAYNGFQMVNDSEDAISEELDRMILQIPAGINDPSAPEDDSIVSEPSVESAAENDGIMEWIDAKLILNTVETLISKCIVHQNSAMLLVFAEGVKYVCSVLITELVEKYELLFSLNMGFLNDPEEVTKALNLLGIKTGEHFFPARAELEEILSNTAEKVEKFIEATEYTVGIRDKEDLDTDSSSAVAAQISQSVATLFALFEPIEKRRGLQQTLDILEYVTNFYITEKSTEFDRLRTDADKIFQTNASLVGDSKAHQILAKLKMSIDPKEIALKCASPELDDAQLDCLLKGYSASPSANDKATDCSERITLQDSDSEDDFLTSLTMSTCSAFMNKIRYLDCVDNPQKLLEKVLHFVLTRFARDTSDSLEQFQQLECNLDILGAAKYKIFLKKLKACPQKNKATLQRTSELLMACGDDVVLEYFELFNSDNQMESVKLWQSSADAEGLQVKSIQSCCIDLSDLEFRDLAMSLFHVQIDTNFSVRKYKDEVMAYLKSEDYIITFSLNEESGSWLVILADQRVNQFDD